MEQTKRDRNDWLVLLLFLLLGVLLMLLAGQKGTQLLPYWNLRADVGSNLDPYQFQAGDSQGLAPLRPEILTPPAWGDSYLTPQGDQPSATPPTFVVFDPSATPSATPSPSVTASVEPSLTATTVTITVTTTRTRKPGDDPTPSATATGTATSTGIPSTLDPALTEISPTPAGLNEGPPDGSTADGSDFPDGSFTIVDISANPIVVGPTPDGNYDLVYYEDENPNGSNEIAMDQVIVGITNYDLWYNNNNTYYEVFNWGNGVADDNSNVSTTDLGLPTAENDNQVISTNDLYLDPSAPPPPPNAQTGILIDVDGAPSNPPPGTYDIVVIIAPPASAPNNDGDGGQVDSVDVTDESLPP